MALRQEEFTGLCDDVDLDRDRALVERCQAGDSAAYGNLYARYNERLLRFCLRRLNDRHEAEDAAQEAFARAWKALPNFAGERRFYPWLTVIAGNICTDMLRRRSRSTPTDDLELTLCQPIGSTGNVANDEGLMAAVDGELVHKALDRLSVRHRHVLALREGSGLTYQQIADEEGVEIGTIETLLWRARQALKREFTVLSESKGALGGFLIGLGVFARRGLLRLAPRNAALQTGSGTGTFRNAFAGVAVTSAAVAAAFVAPHALSAPHPTTPSSATALARPAATGEAGRARSVTPPTGSGASGSAATPSSITAGSAAAPPTATNSGASSANASSGLELPTVDTPAGAPLPSLTGSSPAPGLVKSIASGVAAATDSPGVPQSVTKPITDTVGTVGAAAQTVVSGVGGLLSTIAGDLAGTTGAATSSGATSSGATSSGATSSGAPSTTTAPALPVLSGGATPPLPNPLQGLR